MTREFRFDSFNGFIRRAAVNFHQIGDAGFGFGIITHIGFRIGDGPFEFFHNDIRRVGHGDKSVEIGVGFTHFGSGVLQAHNPASGAAEERLRHGKGWAVGGVKAFGNIPGKLNVLFLIGADRHQIRLVKQNVGGHQHGIVEKPDTDG